MQKLQHLNSLDKTIMLPAVKLSSVLLAGISSSNEKTQLIFTMSLLVTDDLSYRKWTPVDIFIRTAYTETTLR